MTPTKRGREKPERPARDPDMAGADAARLRAAMAARRRVVDFE